MKFVKMQIAGFYRDVELSKNDDEENEVRQKIDEIQGTSRGYTDDVFTILEMHVDLDLEGFEDIAPDGETYRYSSAIHCYDRTRDQGRFLRFDVTLRRVLI